MCDNYLESYHKEAIFHILEDEDENKHFSININFLELFENEPNLGSSLLKEPEKNLEDWNIGFKKVQTRLILQTERNCIIKKNVHCRIFGLPVCSDLHRTVFPKNIDANKFLQISGTVVRVTVMKVLEYQRQYICTKCKHVTMVNAEYEKKHMIVPPKRCGNPEGCKGTNIISTGELNPEFCKDYQEMKIQENVSKLDVGCVPNSMWVTLEDDLVDCCKPGDNITVCGIVKRRWNQFHVGKKMEIELVIKANYVQVNNNNSTSSITTDLKDMFENFWKTYSDRPLAARDIILKSICPQIFGLYVVKLAIAVTLAGGSRFNDNSNTGVRVRAEPHLLLVGDPGTGKSQLLRFAAKIIPRSVLTTGVGSTAAGLTVTALMENGEWQLEGGALVLADGGICCIDEFNSMKEHDRTSIHEAMEQQTISVAKASIVCKLSTRCTILAATNPKGNIDPTQPLSMNIALASPLLSRFDLILLLRDKINQEWDSSVADYILNSQNNTSKLVDNIYWTVETLQVYFAVIKKFHPILTEDSNKILSSYYQAQRRKDSRNKARTTVRLLDSLVRLSQGHARLMYHKEVQIVDAVVAVILVETAMEADSSVFGLHFDVQSDFPINPMNSYRELVEIVLKKLHLDYLLEKELETLNNQTSNVVNFKVENNFEVIEREIESRFFQCQRKSEDVEKDTDNKENVIDERPVNIRKVKRTKNKDDNKPTKKIKLNKKENEVVNDLAALNCMPSIFDLPFSDSDNDEDYPNLQAGINNAIEIDTNEIIDNESQSEIPEKSVIKILQESEDIETVNSKIDDSENNTTNMELKPHEKESNEKKSVSKYRNILSKFKFMPKDETVAINSHEMTSKNNKENTVIEKSPEQNNTNTKESTPSKTVEEPDDILKDLKTMPQSTQRQIPRFKFKKKEVQQIETPQLENHLILKTPSHSSGSSHTIFESQEDLDDLDLDL